MFNMSTSDTKENEMKLFIKDILKDYGPGSVGKTLSELAQELWDAEKFDYWTVGAVMELEDGWEEYVVTQEDYDARVHVQNSQTLVLGFRIDYFNSILDSEFDHQSILL